MSFKLYSTDDGHVPAWEYLPASQFTPLVGMGLALNASTGQLEPSNLPAYICMRTEAEAVSAGTVIPCVKIAADQVWQNYLYSDAPNAKAGSFADVDATGKWVNARDVSNSNFQINFITGSGMEAYVRGRFVK